MEYLACGLPKSTNVRLEWLRLTVTNALTYYDVESTMAVKSFVVQVPALQIRSFGINNGFFILINSSYIDAFSGKRKPIE